MSRVAVTRRGLRVLNVQGDWGAAEDFLGARLKGHCCPLCHWRLQTSPNKSPCTLAVKPGRFAKLWNFSLSLDYYISREKSIVLLMIGWKCLSLNDWAFLFFHRCLELASAEFNFDENHGLLPLQKLKNCRIRIDAASIKSFFWFPYPIDRALRLYRNIRIAILNKTLCHLVQVTSVTHFRGWENNVSLGNCDRICTQSFIPASCYVFQGLSGACGELKLERFLDPSR